MSKFNAGRASVLIFLAILGIVSSLLLVTFGASSIKAVTLPFTTTYDFITTDNGMQGLWATDNFHSNVTITSIGDGCYQVVREDSGNFEVLTGAMSPGGVGGNLVGNGTKGTISGGLTDIVCGTLRETPLSNDSPEDLRTGQYASYEDKYFHKFFSEITSGNITNWGWTFRTCNNGTWVDNAENEASYPSGVMGDIAGEYVPCTPPDVCPNLDGVQTSVPDGLHLDAGNINCVAYAVPGEQIGGGGGPTGQVLGVSTLAKTGTFEENLYLAIMTLGGLLTFKSAQNFKKAFKKAN